MMKHLEPEFYLIIGLLLASVVCSIPFTQVVDTIRVADYGSDSQNQIEIGFGGPRVTWVNVVCNTTVDIQFMYQNGTWISTQNVLLASVRTISASYNFNAEHSTTVVVISSDSPFRVRITYTYPIEMEMSIFNRIFYTIGYFVSNEN
jgi:hypothetical protein